MSPRLERSHLEQFRSLVRLRLGLEFEGNGLDTLADVLRQRVSLSPSGRVDSYLHRLTLADPAEVRALAERLTVSETYFFRYADHFRAFVETAIPSRLRDGRDRRTLSILSAGCASGEEAYSLGIALREHFGGELDSWSVTILGIDVNPRAIERARRAHYSGWSLRSASPELKERYFRLDGGEFVLDDAVRRMVTFEERNLVTDGVSADDEVFDAIFCRNVLMYFAPDVMRGVVERIRCALAPGGFLFLGHAETLRGVSQRFHLCHTEEAFYYQRREGGEERPAPALRATENESSWVDAIEGAAARIQALSREMPLAAPEPARSTSSAINVTAALEMLRLERFAEGIELLGAQETTETDPDVLLLRAVLFANGGRVAEAEQVCARILAVDEVNAGAHYVMALCREHAGDLRGAVEHDQTAAYLDGQFVMPHLHLGLLARRSGDVDEARGELERALALLAREDTFRIVLFGGGFTRDTLARLCRSEIQACGGMS
ncbi:MAG TPA: CheR family methyltransferase [Polyangiaceae bacterium]|jgi:chemotaxis protein methyltransferase CheR